MQADMSADNNVTQTTNCLSVFLVFYPLVGSTYA